MSGSGGWLHRLVFRPPSPSTYSECTLPQVEFTKTSCGNTIPLVHYNTWNLPSYLHPTKLWILFSHGNSEDLGNVSVWAEFLSDNLRMSVLCYDYSGFGLSASNAYDEEGEEIGLVASEDNLRLDSEAALEFARERYGLLAEDCIVWGRSLGGCACVHLATTRQVAGAILQSSFVSVLAVGTSSIWGEEYAAYDMFRNLDALRRTPPTCPVFLIHGKRDMICNWWHTRQLARAMPILWPPLLDENCGHNDLELNCKELLHEVYEFIEFCSFVRGYRDG